jgi:hypothetical protein
MAGEAFAPHSRSKRAADNRGRQDEQAEPEEERQGKGDEKPAPERTPVRRGGHQALWGRGLDLAAGGRDPRPRARCMHPPRPYGRARHQSGSCRDHSPGLGALAGVTRPSAKGLRGRAVRHDLRRSRGRALRSGNDVRTRLRGLGGRYDRSIHGRGCRRDAVRRRWSIRTHGSAGERSLRLRDRNDRVVQRVTGDRRRSLILRLVRLILLVRHRAAGGVRKIVACRFVGRLGFFV